MSQMPYPAAAKSLTLSSMVSATSAADSDRAVEQEPPDIRLRPVGQQRGVVVRGHRAQHEALGAQQRGPCRQATQPAAARRASPAPP